jgi:hypothetical protein
MQPDDAKPESSSPDPSGPDHALPDEALPDYANAVAVDSADGEHAYVAGQTCRSCGGPLRETGEALVQHHSKSYDVLHATCRSCGVERDFTFDISSFYCSNIFDWGGRFD